MIISCVLLTTSFYISANSLFVICPLLTDRSQVSAQWKSENQGDDTIIIPVNDAKRTCTGAAGSVTCTYFIAVYSPLGDTEYYVSAVAARPATLTAGVAASGAAAANQMTYYALPVQTKDLPSLSISILPTAGSPWLYVRTGEVPTETQQGFTWALEGAAATGGRLELTAAVGPAGTHGWCDGYNKTTGAAEECVYYIGVVSSTETAFTITASLASTMTQLREGAPVTLSAPANEYKDFYLYVQPADGAPAGQTFSNSDVMIIVTPLSGFPETYAAYGYEQPRREKHEYEAASWGVDVLTIRNATVGQLYIAVGGGLSEATLFTITAHVLRAGDSQRTTTLVDGVPQVCLSILTILSDISHG